MFELVGQPQEVAGVRPRLMLNASVQADTLIFHVLATCQRAYIDDTAEAGEEH